MKTLLNLFLFVLSIAYFNLGFSNFQSHGNQANSVGIKCCKNYISIERLHFSDKGIFLRDDTDRWFAINQLNHDEQGYYLAGFWDILFPKGHYIAKCKNCGVEYHDRSPQPCEACEKSRGFQVIYIENDPYGNEINS